MVGTMPEPKPSTPFNSLDDVRPRMAKADAPSQSPSIGLTSVVKDALIRHYGSLKAAAITFGMDPGQLTRELQSGDFKLKKLECDPAAVVAVAHAVHDAFGQLLDPKAHARHAIREARRHLDDLAQILEGVV